MNWAKNILFLFLIALILGCGLKKETEFAGKTMGTTYHIKVVTWRVKNLDALRFEIDKRLEEINNSMSTYIPSSEISRFNSMRETGKKMYVSEDFLKVAKVARDIYEITQGAWDATVMPLIELWGFANSNGKISEMRTDIPHPNIIKHVLNNIGFDKIEISDQGYLEKRQRSVSIDFASIAKGYAVDQVANVIRKEGIHNFLVEIGGEVYTSGRRGDGRNWRIGINTPRRDSPENMIYGAVDLTNEALATSGDYRNFFEVNGKFYSHIMDPRTGYPVSNGVVSVSIIADTCVFADGLATGVMVMGPSNGIELVNRLDGVECLIITNEGGGLRGYYSRGFKKFQP